MSRKIADNKVFLLGIDGGTFQVIDYLIAQDKLPNMARLMRHGARAVLQSTIPPITPAAWLSLATGKNPGKHGIVDFLQRAPNSYRFRPVDSRSNAEPTLWEILSQKGKKVVVYNVPVTYPPHEVNGVIISGMDTPGLESEFTYPSYLREKIAAAFPDYRIDVQIDWSIEDSWIREWYVSEIDKMLNARLDVLDYLLNEQEWDFFFTVLVAADRLQHIFWRYVEEDLRGEANEHAQAVFSCYEKIDAKIGEISTRLGEEVTIILVSDHGFGLLSQDVNLNQVLANAGFLQFRQLTAAEKGFQSLRTLLREKLPLPLWVVAKSLAPSPVKVLKEELDATENRIRWDKTRAYSQGFFGNIYLNLADREPAGVVAPGRDYTAVREEIIHLLYDLRDPDDGQPIVDRVYKREEIWEGQNLSKLPDLVIVMRNYAYMARHSFGLTTQYIVQEPMKGWGKLAHTGNHRLEGILIMRGPAISPGLDIGTAHIIDVAPTILYLMGLEVPEAMDGIVLTGCMKRPFLRGPVRFGGDSPAGHRGEKGYSERDEEIVEERLRGLGYLS